MRDKFLTRRKPSSNQAQDVEIEDADEPADGIADEKSLSKISDIVADEGSLSEISDIDMDE